MYNFDSRIHERGDFSKTWEQELVKNEPMFFNCDLDFAYKNGGPITRNFIENLPKDWLQCHPVLDSRVHMLMPGWYPCIPGYHHDDVPRSEDSNGQPDYDNPIYQSEHLMGLVNGDICPTNFMIGNFDLDKVDTSKDVIYRKWDEDLMKNPGTIVPAKSGKYIQFDCDSFHTGTKAVGSGWRWFIRLSRNTSRQMKITNETRSQVQVYLEFPTMGW